MEWDELCRADPEEADIAVLLAVSVGALRREQNLKQEELSLKANVNRVILSHIETCQGNTTLATIKKIAKALGTTEMSLLQYGQGFLRQKQKQEGVKN